MEGRARGASALTDYAWYLAGYLLPRVGTLAALGLYTRAIAPEVYADYALATTSVSLATTVALYWIHTSLQRLLPAARGDAAAKLTGTAISVGACLVALAAPLLALAGAHIGRTLAWPTAAAFAGQSLFLFACATTISAGDRARFAVYSSLDAIVRLALGATAVSAGLGIEGLLALPASTGAAIFVWEVARLRRGGRLTFGIDRGALASMTAFGLPLVAVWASALLLSSLDRFLLRALAAPAAQGTYAAAYPLGDALVQVFATPLLPTVATRVFTLAEQAGHREARAELRRAVDASASGFGLLVAVAIASAPAITRVFLGAEYSAGAAVLPWVSAGLVFWGITSLLAKEFELERRPGRSVLPICAGVGVNVAANLALIPRAGAAGAAIATALSYFACFVATGWLAKSGPLTLVARSWRAVSGAIAAGFAGRWAAELLPPGLASLLGGTLAAAAGYLALLFVLRDPHLRTLGSALFSRARLRARAVLPLAALPLACAGPPSAPARRHDVANALEARRLHVRAFGAKADGVTDDLGAFAAAVRAARPGDVVHVGAGTHRLSGTLRIDRPGITLAGVGRESVLRGGGAGHLVEIRADGTSFRGIAFEGDGRGARQFAIFTSADAPARGGVVEGCWFGGPPGAIGLHNGIKLDTASDGWVIRESRFAALAGTSDGHGYGVLVGAASGTLVEACTFSGSPDRGRHGVYLSGGASHSKVTRNRIDFFQESSIALYSMAHQPATEHNLVTENVIVGQGAGSTDSAAIELAGNVRENRVERNTIVAAGRAAVIVTDARVGGLNTHNRIEGNLIAFPAASGIYLLGASRARVAGNTIVGPNAGPPFDTYAGITILDQEAPPAVASGDIEVFGNVVRASGEPTYAFALRHAGARKASIVARDNDLAPGRREPSPEPARKHE
jgi:O-antigen/teichoic acid export membrane protein/nitrous oxidase accessory protein NosD